MEDENKTEKVDAPLNTMGYLPADFDIHERIYSYRFWLMCKLKFPYNEVFEKRHDFFLKELREYLLNAYPDARICERIVNRIVQSAYNTIPGEFWTALEKKPLPDHSKPLPIPRVSKPVFTNNNEYRKYKRENRNRPRNH